MSLTATGGRILIKDGAHTVFDTDQKLLAITDTVTGTYSIPARAAPSNVVGTYTIATGLPSVVDFVAGMMKVTTIDPFFGVAGTRWLTVGGTYVHMLVGAYRSNDTECRNIQSACLLTFTASGGSLILNERTYSRSHAVPGGTWPSMLAMDIDYHIICGTFV